MIATRLILRALAALLPVAVLAAPGPDAWQTPQPANGSVTLAEQSGLLAVRYSVLPSVPQLIGNRTRLANDTDLLLKTPQPLQSGTERLTFEAKGLAKEGKDVPSAIELWPIVRDEHGELFYFIPRDIANLNPVNGGWSAYSTAGFYAGEAGAATHAMYLTGGVPDNSRPDGKLTLLGYRLHVTLPVSERDLQQGKKADKPIAGTLYLGDCREEPFKLTFAYPFAYADGFLKKAGQYVFAAQVTDEFQGTPIREFRRQLAFDPQDPASCRQKLEFPLGPDGIYWIDYQIVAADGGTVASGFMQHQVLGNPERSAPTPAALDRAPAIGYLRVNPGDPRRGVYAPEDPLRVNVRLFPQGKRQLTLRYVLYPYFFADPLSTGEKTLAPADDAPQNLELSFSNAPAGNAFRLELELLEQGTRIDQRTWFLGRRNTPPGEHPRAGALIDRHELKKDAYNRFTYVRTDGNAPGKNTRQALVGDFREYLARTYAFIQHHTYMVELNDFEVLPGVFDFSLLDEIMDAAADYGCKVTLRFAHGDKQAGPYRWGKFSRQISAEGAVIDMAPYGAYAVTDPALSKLWHDAYRATYDRYRHHTAFEGYYIMKPGGEWTVVDQPWAGSVAGYSPVESQGFRDYLQKTLGLSLAQLNQRWGSRYAAFTEVQPPMPRFRDGSTPDLRVEWFDFCRFKAGLNAKFWVPSAINYIRSFDNDRATIVYGYPSEFPELYGKLDYGHNGGNHRLDHQGEFETAWRKGQIGWITEPIHPHGWAAWNDPGRNGWVLDVSVWTMIAQAGGGGANLHIYYLPKPSHDMVEHEGGFYALDRFERFKPILRELQQARLVPQLAEIAVNQDDETLYAKHRTTFGARLADLRRWFELLENDGIPYAELNAFPEASFKLIVPNILDEVLAQETFDRYVKSVKEGGARIVLTANTGKYVVGAGQEPFQLLKALGIAAPQRPYVTQGTVVATATAASPLFAKGSSIPFQTVATMREQMHSKDVIEHFWQYPYRWIPETDYFGYYPGQQPGGEVLATFADGGAAVSLHQAGRGQVLVFWGTPDISGDKLKGLMKRVADWAGVRNPLAEAEVPRFIEMSNPEKKRHYGLCYQEDKFGKFRVKFPNCPNGDYFCDETVSDRRLGRYQGKDLRETGILLEWSPGESPLKIVRAIPAGKVPPAWVDAYTPAK